MNKRTAGVVLSARPNWQRNVLSKAIAMAGASLQASAAMAACPTTQVTAAQTTACTVTGGETATITTTGSIIVPAAPAIVLTGAGDKAVDNSGIVSGTPQGIYDNGAGGVVTITNNLTPPGFSTSSSIAGLIHGSTTGVFINGASTLSLTNNGVILGGASGSDAYGVYIAGDLDVDSSITNTGLISGSVTGTTEGFAFVRATGIHIGGPLGGTITNSGTISGDASASGAGIGHGIFISGDLTGTLNNSGNISASGFGFYGEAVGVTVLGALTGSLTNAAGGNITATATGGSGGFSGGAYGIYVNSSVDTDATLTNAGTITSTATGVSSESMYAAGIYLNSTVYGAVSNSGTIDVSASAETALVSVDAVADGIYVHSIAAGGSVTNSGSISVSVSASDTASVAGIYVSWTTAGTILNSGTITVGAAANNSATAIGIWLSSAMATDSSITNSGTINVTAGGDGAEGAAIYVPNNIAGSIENSGTINVDMSGGFFASAGGIVGGSAMAGTGSITNSGTMSVAAHASTLAFATGIYLSSSMASGASITNSGTMSVSANVSNTSGFASAAGIWVSSAMADGSSVTNSGTIEVAASGTGFDGAEGIHIRTMQAGATLENSGTIDVTGGTLFSSESATVPNAFGIVVSRLNGGATLTNSGTVTANGPAGPGTGWAMVVWNGTSSGEVGLPVISNTGTLRGNILLNNASLNNSGLLSIPVSNGLVYSVINNGNYTQLAGGVLEIGAFSSSSYGRLSVNGTADFTESGQFAVNVSTFDLLNPGDILDNVVSAATLVTNGDSSLSVTDNSPFWQFTASDDGEGGIDLLVSGQPRGFLTAAGAQVMNVNLDALQGEVMGRMDVRRLIERNGGHDQNLWFRPYGSWATLDDNGSSSVGYDNDTYGMVIGYDTYLGGSDWNFGGAFSYAQSDVDSKSSLNKDKIETDLYSGSIYAYGNLSPDTFVDLLAIAGWGSSDTTRSLGVNGHATGDYDSWYARLSGAFGRNFQLNQQWTFTPVGSIIYTYVDQDSYKEKGPTGLALSVDSADADSLIFMLDGIFSLQINPGALLTAHAGGGYDALADDMTVSADFVGGGTGFKTKTDAPDDWLAVAGVGAEFAASEAVEIHFNYDYEYRNDYSNNQVVATLRWKL